MKAQSLANAELAPAPEAQPKARRKCFIVMPITTPPGWEKEYADGKEHFAHVLEYLFVPAVEQAGFDPIRPSAEGSTVIPATIISYLDTADLVLCDLSILNPNVIFEFGVRTAMDKPLALVRDDKELKIPFDFQDLHHHKYRSSLALWDIKQEIKALAGHVRKTYGDSAGRNHYWKVFGFRVASVLKATQPTSEDKLELILQMVSALAQKSDLEDEERRAALIKRMLDQERRLSPEAPWLAKKNEWEGFIRAMLSTPTLDEFDDATVERDGKSSV